MIVLAGIGGALPLAIGGRWRWWLAATTAAEAAFAVPRGAASAALVVPFAVVAAATLLAWLGAAGPPRAMGLAGAAAGLARAYAVVAALALAQSRAGRGLFGLGEPLVELTAVHYMFAGCAALVLAARTLAAGSPRWAPAAAVALTGLAPPVVAAGFVTGAAVPQVGGAALVAAGVCTTAALQLGRAAARPRRWRPDLLLGVSGLAVWAPMALAVAWAAGQHGPVPALSIPAMVRTHGLVNAVAFVLCGLAAGPPDRAYAARAPEEEGSDHGDGQVRPRRPVVGRSRVARSGGGLGVLLRPVRLAGRRPRS